MRIGTIVRPPSSIRLHSFIHHIHINIVIIKSNKNEEESGEKNDKRAQNFNFIKVIKILLLNILFRCFIPFYYSSD